MIFLSPQNALMEVCCYTNIYDTCFLFRDQSKIVAFHISVYITLKKSFLFWFSFEIILLLLCFYLKKKLKTNECSTIMQRSLCFSREIKICRWKKDQIYRVWPLWRIFNERKRAIIPSRGTPIYFGWVQHLNKNICPWIVEDSFML